jgi:hypothetical protein
VQFRWDAVANCDTDKTELAPDAQPPWPSVWHLARCRWTAARPFASMSGRACQDRRYTASVLG